MRGRGCLGWFDAAVALTASWQKIFSADPKLGFFAQGARFSAALDQGKVLAPAKSLDDMHAVVTNSTVDGVLSILFAALIVIVLADAARACLRAWRSPTPVASSEDAAFPSTIVAPSGLVATAAERRELAAAEASPRGQ